MSRYDKYEPFGGGFRAPLAVATVFTAGVPYIGDEFRAYAVGLDVNGRVVLGGGTTGIVGVYIAHGRKNIGDIVDVMTDGEIVEFTTGAYPGTPAVAGTKYIAPVATGIIVAGSPIATSPMIGFTQSADRLIVRVNRPGI